VAAVVPFNFDGRAECAQLRIGGGVPADWIIHAGLDPYEIPMEGIG
jgi:hypothetical protein